MGKTGFSTRPWLLVESRLPWPGRSMNSRYRCQLTLRMRTRRVTEIRKHSCERLTVLRNSSAEPEVSRNNDLNPTISGLRPRMNEAQRNVGLARL